MSEKIIKNREGRIVGRIKGEWLLGRSGLPVARYIPSVDKTVTNGGRIVGNGDQRLRKLNDR